MVNIEYAFQKLIEENRIYVSEADLQFAFAWKIKEIYPNVKIRLEYVPWEFDDKMHIDIAVFYENKIIPIELKYKTKLSRVSANGEKLYLKNQSAQDCGRYDFLRDIQRMEEFKDSKYSVDKAYAIFMTNDSGYWNKSKKSDTPNPPVDDEFRIHENAIISGTRHWKSNASAGTTKGREKPISLKNVYEIKWKETKPCNDFVYKYLIITI